MLTGSSIHIYFNNIDAYSITWLFQYGACHYDIFVRWVSSGFSNMFSRSPQGVPCDFPLLQTVLMGIRVCLLVTCWLYTVISWVSDGYGLVLDTQRTERERGCMSALLFQGFIITSWHIWHRNGWHFGQNLTFFGRQWQELPTIWDIFGDQIWKRSQFCACVPKGTKYYSMMRF